MFESHTVEMMTTLEDAGRGVLCLNLWLVGESTSSCCIDLLLVQWACRGSPKFPVRCPRGWWLWDLGGEIHGDMVALVRDRAARLGVYGLRVPGKIFLLFARKSNV